MASSTAAAQPVLTEDQKRQKALEDYRRKLIEHRELDAKLKKSNFTNWYRHSVGRCSFYLVREELKDLTKNFDHSEEDLKSLQSGVGQIVGEVLRQLTEEKCMLYKVF